MSIERDGEAVNGFYWLHPVIGLERDGDPSITDYMGYPLSYADVLHLQDVIQQYLTLHTPENWPTDRRPDPSAGTLKALKPEKKVGIIYLLSGHGHYKIGLSTDPARRLKSYLKLPFEVTLIHIIQTSDVKASEAYWHDRFADKRGNGEWFNLSTDDVAEFCGVSEMDVTP